MKVVTLSPRSGDVSLVEAPDPVAAPGRVVIANAVSIVSTGTERGLLRLASSSLLGKARRRPDQLRQVLRSVRREGLVATWEKVERRLEEPIALGYSSAGVVLEVGRGVEGLSPGDRVASNGPHASVVSVPRSLVVPLPAGLDLERGAFTVLGAVALHGLRLARVGLGERVHVVGLGLVGQLAVQLAAASGCRVSATDPRHERCALALRHGAEAASPDLGGEALEGAAGGADAVLLCASSEDSAPARTAVESVRPKGRVVIVGATGLDLDRRALYERECELVVSRSYGPGRYEEDYEARGRDLPASHVRWTLNRNLQEVARLLADGALSVDELVSHRLPIESAERAYEIVRRDADALAIVLRLDEESGDDASASAPAAHDDEDRSEGDGDDAHAHRAATTDRPLRRTVELDSEATEGTGRVGVAVIGAGHHARVTLLPLLARQDKLRRVLLVSEGGLSARLAGARHGFSAVGTDEAEALTRPGVGAVMILTRHARHAEQAVAALDAGRDVFCEKPLALTREELHAVDRAMARRPEARLAVGFNRRFSPSVRALAAHFDEVEEPLLVTVRFNAGALPAEHWTQQDEEGGRLVGEACHAIDLASFLARSPPARVHAEVASGAGSPDVTSDRAVLTLRHENGAVSSIAYSGGGSRSLPKERVEVFGGGRAAVLDDLRALELHGSGRSRRRRFRREPGHAELLGAWARSVAEHEDPPVPWRELRAISLAAIAAAESARLGVAIELSGEIAPDSAEPSGAQAPASSDAEPDSPEAALRGDEADD